MAEAQQRKPPLEDPLHEKEVFANDVAGIAIVHGNFIITLANLRLDESIGDQGPKPRRVVTARIVLTNVAAEQLLQNLQRAAAQIQAMADPAGKKQN